MQNHICRTFPQDDIGIIFRYMLKVCRILTPYPNAYAKVKKWIFVVQFPGNWFEFGIIGNDFQSSTFWAIQINVSFTEFKNPKNPVIQPSYVKELICHSRKSIFWSSEVKWSPSILLTESSVRYVIGSLFNLINYES